MVAFQGKPGTQYTQSQGTRKAFQDAVLQELSSVLSGGGPRLIT